MSKLKALSLAVLMLGLAFACLPMQLYACFWPFLIAACVFGAIVYAKYRRDLDLIKAAEQELQRPRRQLPPAVPMTSNGSNRLFLPPPLEERK